MSSAILLSILATSIHFGAAPAESAASAAEFRLADGLQIEVFASDPSIAKPIQMNFDARGRLWLVTSESYPQLEPGLDPRDKIYVLEDTDHDGKADKTTTFAEGLRIPTGIEIGPDGAFVGNATELLQLRDTDGDGKADKREVALTAFGTEDTHHLIHTFRYAPWGNLFFAQAVYIHSHVETPFGTRRLNGGGYWEYNPRSGRLDIFVTGMTNSWGLAFDAYGQAFGVDNDGYSVNYFPPGAHMIRTPNESHLYPSLVEGKPKYCGAEFVATPPSRMIGRGTWLRATSAPTASLATRSRRTAEGLRPRSCRRFSRRRMFPFVRLMSSSGRMGLSTFAIGSIQSSIMVKSIFETQARQDAWPNLADHPSRSPEPAIVARRGVEDRW